MGHEWTMSHANRHCSGNNICRFAGTSKDGSDGTRTRDLRRDRCDETVASGFVYPREPRNDATSSTFKRDFPPEDLSPGFTQSFPCRFQRRTADMRAGDRKAENGTFPSFVGYELRRGYGVGAAIVPRSRSVSASEGL
jgi:hypothetical protein